MVEVRMDEWINKTSDFDFGDTVPRFPLTVSVGVF